MLNQTRQASGRESLNYRHYRALTWAGAAQGSRTPGIAQSRALPGPSEVPRGRTNLQELGKLNPCSHCPGGKPRPGLNFVNTARGCSGRGTRGGCEDPHGGGESWQRFGVGSAQPSPVPASPSPLNKHPCTKQKARRIPPTSPAKGMRSPSGIGRAAGKIAKVPFEFFHQCPNKYIWAGKWRRQIPSCYGRALTGLVPSVNQSRKSGLS